MVLYLVCLGSSRQENSLLIRADLETLLGLDSENSTAREELQELQGHRKEREVTISPFTIADEEQADEVRRSAKRAAMQEQAAIITSGESTSSEPPAPRPATGFAALRKNRESSKSTFLTQSKSSASSRNDNESAESPVHNAPLRPSPSHVKSAQPPTDPRSIAPGAGLALLRTLQASSCTVGWDILALYPTVNVATILGPILEPDTLGLLLAILRVGIDHDMARVKEIMQGLRSAPRIKLNAAMLDSSVSQTGREVWEACGQKDRWP